MGISQEEQFEKPDEMLSRGHPWKSIVFHPGAAGILLVTETRRISSLYGPPSPAVDVFYKEVPFPGHESTILYNIILRHDQKKVLGNTKVCCVNRQQPSPTVFSYWEPALRTLD